MGKIEARQPDKRLAARGFVLTGGSNKVKGKIDFLSFSLLQDEVEDDRNMESVLARRARRDEFFWF